MENEILTPLKKEEKLKDFTPTSNTLSFVEIQRIAEVFRTAGMIKDSADLAKSIVKILAGAEMGIGPFASVRGIYPMQGNVAYSAHLMSSQIWKYGIKHYVKQLDDTVCEIIFQVPGMPPQSSKFTVENAKAAELLDGHNKHSWKKYRRNMLWSRAMSNGARWFCGGAFGGIPPYTPEELGANLDNDEFSEQRLDATPTPSPTPTTPEITPLSLDALQGAQEEELEMGAL